MLYQERMIQKVKEKSQHDSLIIATMMYGSFTQNCGDEYSDIEFYIFIKNEEFQSFDSRPWIEDISPFYTHFTNEFGSEVVIFTNLIRGEFHFLPEKDMGVISSFKPVGYFPDTDAMLIYDSNGKLRQYLDSLKGSNVNRSTNQNIEIVWNNLLNTLLLGVNVLKRGETARALEWLWYVQRYLLQLVRINEGVTERWVNPSKNLEKDIKSETYQKYYQCTAKLSESELYLAYNNALNFGYELINELDKLYKINTQKDLVAKLGKYFNVALRGGGKDVPTRWI